MWLSRGTREKAGRGAGRPALECSFKRESLLTGRHASELRHGNLPAGLEQANPIKGGSMGPAWSIGEVLLALKHHGHISHAFPKGA